MPLLASSQMVPEPARHRARSASAQAGDMSAKKARWVTGRADFAAGNRSPLAVSSANHDLRYPVLGLRAMQNLPQGRTNMGLDL